MAFASSLYSRAAPAVSYLSGWMCYDFTDRKWASVDFVVMMLDHRQIVQTIGLRYAVCRLSFTLVESL
jgi:hypothetical protein